MTDLPDRDDGLVAHNPDSSDELLAQWAHHYDREKARRAERARRREEEENQQAITDRLNHEARVKQALDRSPIRVRVTREPYERER
jgi:hypothetical protein